MTGNGKSVKPFENPGEFQEIRNLSEPKPHIRLSVSSSLSSFPTARSSDVHEASYLPFLFSAGDGDLTEVDSADIIHRKATGRRTFDKHGEEVTMEVLYLRWCAEVAKVPRD